MQLKRKFKNVGVLMGGLSAEKQISLESGSAVFKALKFRGYDVTSLVVKDKGQAVRLIKKERVDCVFIAMHGGFGEDGTMQKSLDEMRIPYTGSGYKASSLAMDKIESKRILERSDLPVPVYKTLKDCKYPTSFNGLSLPLVIKPSNQGSSIGLTIIEQESSLLKALKFAYSFGSSIIVEQYIKGKEISVGILDDKPLPVVQIESKRKFYDYQAKYTDGFTEYLVPAPIKKSLYKKAQKLGLCAHRALKCHYFSRVDMRLDENGQIYILEVNSIPGLTSHSLIPKAAQVEGISFEDLCEKILNAACCSK